MHNYGDETEEDEENLRCEKAVERPPAGNSRWKNRLRCILNDKRFHFLMVALILADVAIILVLLFVDLKVIPIAGETEEERLKREHKVESILHYLGLSLLSLFIVEIILRIIVEGKQFLHDKLHVFDAVIVILSFSLDIILTIAPINNAIRDAVILLILLRLWRFFRLICAINICVRKEAHEKLEKERHARELVEKERDFYKEELHKKEELLHELQTHSDPV